MHSRLKIVIFTAPFVIVLLFLLVRMLAPGTYALLAREDSEIEYMQSLFYCMASLFAFFASRNLLHKRQFLNAALCAILAAGLLFVSLEELSWGQRIFKTRTPAFFRQHNNQKELTIHNLMPIERRLYTAYMLTGAYGAFAWIITALAAPGARAKKLHVVNFTVPPLFISPYFFFTFFVYGLFEYCGLPCKNGLLHWRDQEPAEFLLSLGFLVFAVTCYLRSNEGTSSVLQADRYPVGHHTFETPENKPQPLDTVPDA